VLIGHSYGCATAIQAYHSLEPELREKVSHIVLLDPWFFPLTESKLSQ
jgi:pimeloyl-ACP methyl ester carboxylesterase